MTYRNLFLCLLFCVSSSSVFSQVPYGTLYTDATFTKTIDLSKPVGATAATLDVSPSGAATYSIPLSIPPGNNNVVPSVSVGYNSQSGNGIAGRGWHISGLSAIARSAKSNFLDGKVEPVSYTMDDVYSLDGQRLYINSGIYGTHGAIYNEEQLSFATITSHGTYGNGPAYFTVVTKEGATLEYGNSSSSKLLTNDGVHVMMWRLNKMQDANGNYIEYIYDNGSRDSRILQIKYTGNANTTPARLPYNTIDFNYDSRYDENTLYEGGSTLTQRHLLTDITVKCQGLPVRKYTFNYAKNELYSYLIEVVENGTDFSPAKALNSTIFKYGDYENEVSEENISINNQPNLHATRDDIYTADFNADGKSDLAVVNNSLQNNIEYTASITFYKALANGSYHYAGTYTPPNNSINAGRRGFFPTVHNQFPRGDFNGDGMEELLNVSFTSSANSDDIILKGIKLVSANIANTPAAFIEYNLSLPAKDTISWLETIPNGFVKTIEHNIIVGEFNGDRVLDFILISSHDSTSPNDPSWPALGVKLTRAYLYSAKDNFVPKPIANLQLQGVNMASYENAWHTNLHSPHIYPYIYTTDINGDGKSELFCTTQNESQYFELNTDASGEYAATRTVINTILYDFKAIYPADFNGDAKTDLLTYHFIDGWNILESNGKQFHNKAMPLNFLVGYNTNVIGQQNSYTIEDKIQVADFNADGKSDILHIRNGIQLNVYYSNGSTFEQHTQNLSNTLACAPNFTTGEFPTNPLVLTDRDGDGRPDIMYKTTLSGTPIGNISLRRQGYESIMNAILNGYGNQEEIAYKYLTDAICYTTSGVPIPNAANYLAQYDTIKNITVPAICVTKVKSPNGIGGTKETEFKYENMKVHLQSRGLMGFQQIEKSSITDNSKAINEYQFQGNYYTPQLYKSYTYTLIPNQLISEQKNSYSYQSYGAKLFRARLDETIETNHLQQTIKKSSNTGYDYWGNVTKAYSTVFTIGNPANPLEEKEVENNYGSPLGNAINTHLVKTKLTSSRQGASTIVNTTDFAYNSMGNLIQKVDFATLTNPITTSYTYDANGNVLTKILSANGMPSRKTEFEYESGGRFVKKEKYSTVPFNSNYYSEQQITTNSKFGKPSSTIDAAGLVSSYYYDEYGRAVLSAHKVGTAEAYNVNQNYSWETATPGALFSVKMEHPGEADVKTYYDKLGRDIRSETEHPNGGLLSSYKTYDSRGNVSSNAAPHTSTETPLITTYTYDALNRISTESNTLQTNTYTYTYANGNATTTISNSAGQTRSSSLDATGKPIQASDQGGTLNFGYDAWGNKTETKKGNTVLETLVYDSYNRLISKDELNSGTSTYVYDNFGQLIQESDALGQQFNYEYDPEGKVISKTNPAIGTSSYAYKVGIGNKHELEQVNNFNGDIEQFEYDAFGRLVLKTDIINGQMFATGTQYDKYDKSTIKTFPSGLQTENIYDTKGYLIEILLHDGNNSTSIYTSGLYNGYLQPSTYTYGNGTQISKQYVHGFNTKHTASLNGSQTFDWEYTFDYGRANLLGRKDVINNQEELFTYDNLDRLTSSLVVGAAVVAYTYQGGNVAHNGNVLHNGAIGNFGYANAKHALTLASQPDPNCPSGAVCGYVLPNVISENEQNISYTPFKRVAQIEEDVWHMDIRYGDHYHRTLSVLTDNSGVHEMVTKYYVGNYEERITQSGGVQKIHYINGGDGLCAIVTMDALDGTKIHYAYTDHLGSIVLVTDDQGNKEAEQSFDAWGRARDAYDWTNYSISNTPPTWLYRGYTGHEILPEFALINMNARLYDPALGRMLTPDEYLADPCNTQDHNKYSYARNNPLKYTDPSGHIIGTVLTIAFDFLAKAFLQGGLDPTSSNARRQAWSNYDPSASWSLSNKAWRIDKGLFITDDNRTIAGRGVELLLRWTWESPQLWFGNIFSHVRNGILGDVTNVEYFGGATLVNSKGYEGWGLTTGPYINAQNIDENISEDQLFRHEYGHVIQSRIIGPGYLIHVGLFSLIGSGIDGFMGHDHEREWYEVGANRLSERYYRNHHQHSLSIKPWDYDYNSTQQNLNWYFIISKPPMPFMWWLLL